MVGEIHLARIYFTDASTSKVRPVLLLKQNSFNDFLYLPLTTNTNVDGIQINNTSLSEGYLPKVSVVVHEKPGVISPSLLVKKIGTLKEDSYGEIIAGLISFIRQ